MKQYLDLLQKILNEGTRKGDRTGTGTISLFGPQMEFNLEEGFPILTTKKLPFRWIVEELLWFLRGDTNEKNLRDTGVDIWKEWSTKEQCAKFGREEYDLGPVYGYLWRSFGGDYPKKNGVDQIARLVRDLVNNPNSRRHLLTGWDPKTADTVSLPPCHTVSQFYVADGKLSCKMLQRSCDSFIGAPFNIASYALLTYMLAHVCKLKVGKFIHTFGDAHIYLNHLDQVQEQLKRTPKQLPTLTITAKPDIKIDEFVYGDFKLEGYKADPTIKAPIAI